MGMCGCVALLCLDQSWFVAPVEVATNCLLKIHVPASVSVGHGICLLLPAWMAEDKLLHCPQCVPSVDTGSLRTGISLG